MKYLIFHIGETTYGIPITDVVEVWKGRPPAPLPGSPGFVEGVLDLRGASVPVIDLEELFSPGSPRAQTSGPIVVCSVREMPLGIRADEVLEVAELWGNALAQLPRPVLGEGARYVRGIGRLGGRLVIIIDVLGLLTPEEHRTLDEATSEVGCIGPDG